jgi:hypothetical protein
VFPAASPSGWLLSCLPAYLGPCPALRTSVNPDPPTGCNAMKSELCRKSAWRPPSLWGLSSLRNNSSCYFALLRLSCFSTISLLACLTCWFLSASSALRCLSRSFFISWSYWIFSSFYFCFLRLSRISLLILSPFLASNE